MLLSSASFTVPLDHFFVDLHKLGGNLSLVVIFFGVRPAFLTDLSPQTCVPNQSFELFGYVVRIRIYDRQVGGIVFPGRTAPGRR
jgi:hypothetical protein